jgi:hypothetical protein
MALLFACFAQKSLWSDRILCVINLLLSIAIIVYNSLQSGTIPWTGSVAKPFKSNMKGFVTYCPNYHDSLSSIRCCKKKNKTTTKNNLNMYLLFLN